MWVLDDGKGRMYQYSGIAEGKTPKQEKDILLDKRLFRSLDFDLKDASTVVIPDYSGENRFSWASLSSGELLRKSEQIPVSDPELLRESAPAVAQGWNSFVSSVLIRRYWFLSLSLEIGSIFIAWLHKSI